MNNVDNLLQMIAEDKPIHIQGLRHKVCSNPACKSGGALLPIYKYRYIRTSYGVRYAVRCLQCEEEEREFYKKQRIPDDNIPVGALLVRGLVGVNACIEYPYRPENISTILKRRVHFIGLRFGTDTIFTECGRIFDGNGFDTSSDLLHYGTLCNMCIRIYNAKQRQ